MITQRNQTLEQFINANHPPTTAKTYLFEIGNYLKTNPRARYYKYMDIAEFVKGLKDRFEIVSSRITVLSAVKRYYDYLIESGKRSDHPCKLLKIKKAKHQIQLQDLFSNEELQMLFNRPNRYKNIDARDKVVLSLLISLGLTSSEVINIKLSHINFDKDTIYIKGSRYINTRTLEMDRNLSRLLERYINYTRPNMLRTTTDILVLNKLGKPITVDGINSILVPMRSMFPDRKLCPERVRMSVISYWLNDKKMPIEKVMDLSGIKWPSTIEMYKKKDIVSDRELLNRYHPLK